MRNHTLTDEEKPSPIERRLATIMMADVAGYSRMMGEDEERTVQMLRGHRQVFDALLESHRGRIFNTAGDAILAEFPSAVDAVRCATEIQSALRTRNEHFPVEQRMWFRIGINLGDVIVQGTDLLGDGVNVAARIQTIAEPGGICLSGSVYDQIQNKLTLQFTVLGECSFKNIAQPIRTFSISEANGATLPVQPGRNSKHPGRVKHPAAFSAAVLVLILAVVSGFWYHRGNETRRAEEVARAVEAERQDIVDSAEETASVRDDLAEAQRQELEARQAAEAFQNQIKQDAALAQEAKVVQELAAAEEAKRQAIEAQRSAEAYQRQIKLEAEALAARTALERAELERQRLDLELKRVEQEKRAVEEAARGKIAAVPQQAAAPVPMAVDPVDLFDGLYDGTLCNDRHGNQRDKKCWSVLLKIKHGSVSGGWLNAQGKQAVLRGTVSPGQSVAITLEGWKPTGQSIDATLAGKWENAGIRVSGKWRGGVPVSGEWARVQQ